MRRASLSSVALVIYSACGCCSTIQFVLYLDCYVTFKRASQTTVIEIETAYCHLGYTKSRKEYHHYPSEMDAAQSIHQSMSHQQQFPVFNAISTLRSRSIIARFLTNSCLELPGIYRYRSRVRVQLCGYYIFVIPKAACGYELRNILW